MIKVVLPFLLLASSTFSFAETAIVKMTCISLQVDEARAEDDFGFEWSLDITSSDEPDQPNGEMAPADPSSTDFSHSGFFLFTDPFTFEPIMTPFVVDVPPFLDENGNGLSDFFDVEAAVENEQTTGLYFSFQTEDAADFLATWNRSPGETEGIVRLTIPEFGLEFDHVFRIVQSEGTYEFSKDGGQLAGRLSVTNAQGFDEFLTGEVAMAIQKTNELVFPEGTWEGASELAYEHGPARLSSDGPVFTDLLEFRDGNLFTTPQDFNLWILRVEFPDTNSNHVADFLEGGGVGVRPTLIAEKTTEGIRITINGMSGVTYFLQSKGALQDNWGTLREVQMTSASETITLPSDAEAEFLQAQQK